jgi:hypothetical protein
MRLVALLLVLPIAVWAQTAAPEEVSTIEGRVLHAATGEPLAKAYLLLMRIDNSAASFDWERSYSASSDSNGKFTIRSIERGKYRLRASRNGFLTLQYGARYSLRQGTVLDLERAQEMTDIEIRLTPHGVISGRVLDVDGEPLAGVHVQLLRRQYVNGSRTLATAVSATTNDLGEYRWAGLTAGRYYIWADRRAERTPLSTDSEEYVPLYYPGAIDAGGASPLDLTAGAQARAADLMLRKVRTATVKGKVVIELPDAAGVRSVSLNPRAGHNTGGTWFRFYGAKVSAAGEFEIRGVPPGSYSLQAETAKAGKLYGSQMPLDVAEANIEGIVLTIGNPVSFTGRIRVEGETTQDLRTAHIRLRGGQLAGALLLEGNYRIAEDRTFRIEDLQPGRYGVVVEGLPDGFYTKSVRAGEVDVTYSGVDLTGAAVGQVEVVVSPKAGIVSGVAQSVDTNRAAAGATVVLVPKEKERSTIADLYRQTTTDQNGGFTFRSVVPGEYQVYAWEDVERSAWLDPDFVKTAEGKGEPVTLPEMGVASVRVRVIGAVGEP